MSRQGRARSKTDYYHVIMRGNNKSDIFGATKSKAFFLKMLLKVEEEESMGIAAWCIMDNHVHLVIRIPFDNFEHVFKRINVRFAMYYNKSNGSMGHVFQDRVKSIPLETDASLINNIRYVHNNPVKAGITYKSGDYSWSSYRLYMNGTNNEAMKNVRSLIGDNIKSFEAFHLIEDQNEYLEIKEEQNAFREKAVQRIIQNICEEHGITDSEAIKGNKEIVREIVVALSSECTLSARKVAKYVGTSESSVRRIRKL